MTVFSLKKNAPIVVLALVGVIVPSAHAAAQDAKKGQEVYAAQKCQGCHAIGGKGYKANPLDGVGTKLSADDIKAWIVTPKAMATKAQSKAKPPMPDRYAKLPAADIDALVAYMQSLK
jgi:mono/diheme cytochrome c family protein